MINEKSDYRSAIHYQSEAERARSVDALVSNKPPILTSRVTL